MNRKRKKNSSHEIMRLNTLKAIVAALGDGEMSRRGIQRASGLSWGSVSEGFQLLSNAGALVESENGSPEKRRGRRTANFAFNEQRFLTLGMEIKEYEISCSLVSLGKKEIAEYHYPVTNPIGNGNLEKLVKTAFDHLTRAHGIEQDAVECFSFSLPGAVDVEHKIWLQAPQFKQIEDFDFNRLLSSFPGIRTLAVEHDILARARSVCGIKGWNFDNYALIHFSHGIALAVHEDGHFLKGSRGFAGEIGHVPYQTGKEKRLCSCGKRNCFETFLSQQRILEFAHSAGIVTNGYADFPLLTPQEQRTIVQYLTPVLLYLCTIVANMFDPRHLLMGGATLDPWIETLYAQGFDRQLRKRTWMNSPDSIDFYRQQDENSAFGTAISSLPSYCDALLADLLNIAVSTE